MDYKPESKCRCLIYENTIDVDKIVSLNVAVPGGTLWPIFISGCGLLTGPYPERHPVVVLPDKVTCGRLRAEKGRMACPLALLKLLFF